MENTLLAIFGFLLFGGLIFGIGLGIYYKLKDNVITPAKKAKKNKAIADFKFDDFINTVSSLYPSAQRTTSNEELIIFTEKISNGIDKIGEFKYSIEDKISLGENSVGTIKIHDYIISVSFKIRPNAELSYSSEPINTIDMAFCKSRLEGLKQQLTEAQLFKDALDVNRIK
ncbi:MAG: hypothetical protein QM727_12600 [Niabella sp.]